MRRVGIVSAMVLGMACGASAEEGTASFYRGPHPGEMTAAHRAAGSVTVCATLDNGKSVIVKVDDRGPYVRGRVIDVSPAAAKALSFRHAGLAPVRIRPVEPGTTQAASATEAPAAPSAAAICKDDAARVERLAGDPLDLEFQTGLGCGDPGSPPLPVMQAAADFAPEAAGAAAPSAAADGTASRAASASVAAPRQLRPETRHAAYRSRERRSPPNPVLSLFAGLRRAF